jgi:hypothetical protein
MGNGKNGVIGLAACSHLIRPWGRAVSLHDGTARPMFHGLRAISIICLLVQFVKTERPCEVLLIREFAFRFGRVNMPASYVFSFYF